MVKIKSVSLLFCHTTYIFYPKDCTVFLGNVN